MRESPSLKKKKQKKLQDPNLRRAQVEESDGTHVASMLLGPVVLEQWDQG